MTRYVLAAAQTKGIVTQNQNRREIRWTKVLQNRVSIAPCVLLGVLFTGSLPAQTADATMKSFITAANNLTTQLRQIVDADTAQRIAPDLVGSINTLNPLTTQLKALYGVQANQAAIQANGSAVNSAQTQLQQETNRLLTGNCSLEGTVRSPNSPNAITLSLINRTPEPVSVFWINYSGQRASYGTIPPGGTDPQGTYTGHLWLVANAAGTCLGLFQPTATATVIVSGLLTPTLAPFLGNIVK